MKLLSSSLLSRRSADDASSRSSRHISPRALAQRVRLRRECTALATAMLYFNTQIVFPVAVFASQSSPAPRRSATEAPKEAATTGSDSAGKRRSGSQALRERVAGSSRSSRLRLAQAAGDETKKPKQPASPARAMQPLPMISEAPLDLSKPPTEIQLRAAGGEAGPLDTLGNADEDKFKERMRGEFGMNSIKQLEQSALEAVELEQALGTDTPPKVRALATFRKRVLRLRAINLEFGKAVNLRNARRFPETARLMREHLEKYPESPWTGEAMLHLIMDAKYTGRPAEAQARLQALMDITVEDPADPTWEVRCKAKATWADLDLQLGQYTSAIGKLEDILATDGNEHRRAWASAWLTQAKMRSTVKDKTGLQMMNACGSEALGLLFTSLNKKSAAEKIEKMLPPHRDGFSLEEVARISERFGVPLRGFRVTAAAKSRPRATQLAALPLPLIVHYDMARYSAGLPAKTPGAVFGLKRGAAMAAFQGTGAKTAPHCPACPPETATPSAKNKKANGNAFRLRSVGHFLLVRKIDKAKGIITLDDPLADATYKLSFTQFEREWSGAGLMMEGASKGVMPKDVVPQPEKAPQGTRVAAVRLSSLAGFGIAPLDSASMARIRGGCCCSWLWAPFGPPDGNSPPSPQDDDNPCGSPVARINPISMGTYIEDVPIWYNPPIGPSVAPKLSYNSQDFVSFPSFGGKWRMSYESSLMENPGGTVIISEGNGKHNTYRLTATGTYASPTGIFNVLTKTGLNHFEITEPTGEKRIYDRPLDTSNNVLSTQMIRLQEVQDRFGNALKVRYVAYTYVINGTTFFITRVKQLTDAQNKITVFDYDPSTYRCRAIITTNTTTGDVNSPTARRATFTYDANGWLTGVEDMAGNPFSYEYDLTGLVTKLGTEQGDYIFSHRYPGHNPFTNASEYNNETTVTDPQGGSHVYGMYMQIGGPYSGSPRFVYTDAKGAQTICDYGAFIDGVPRLISSETVGMPGRRDWTFDYSNAKMNSMTDENGRTSIITYNWKGMPTSARSPSGQTTRLFYDASGVDLLQVKNHLGNTVASATYTANHQVQTVTSYPTAAATPSYTTTLTYTAWGAPQTVTNPDNEVTTYNYDATTKRLTSVQVSSSTLAAVTVASFAYDALGRVRTSTDAYGLARTVEYNDLNKPVKVSYPDGSNEVIDYVCCSIPGVSIDRSGRKTYRDYDQLKRLRRTQDAEGNTLQLDYDSVGNLKTLLDGRGSVTRWDYDAKNRVIRKIYADGSREGYAYDPAGQLIRSYDARGEVTKYNYDIDGHLLGTDYPNVNNWTSDTTYGYDNLGRLTSMSDGTGNSSWTYDNLGQILTEDGPWADDLLTFTYDSQGRRKTMTVNGSNLRTYNYDSLGRLDTLVAAPGTWNWDYVGNTGLRSLLVAPNGTRTSYSYDTLERLTGVSNRKNDATTILSSFTYGFDNANKKDARWTLTRQSRDTAQALGTAQTLTSGYDNSDQLKTEISNEANPLTKLTRTFDAMGNRLTEVDQGRDTATTGIRNVSSTYTSNRLNQLTSVATTYTDTTTGTATISYDVRGNIAQVNDTKLTTRQIYRFDDENRLRQILTQRVSDNAYLAQTTFFYDGLGRKKWILEQDVVNNVYLNKRLLYLTQDGMDTVQEKDQVYGTAGNTSTIVTTVYQLIRVGNIGGILARTKQSSGQPDRHSYYSYDGSGNVTTITDASQNVQCNYSYSGFGLEKAQEAAGWEQPYRYSTKWQHPNSGLIDYGHRFYHSGWGRWINRDPIAESGGSNLYGMVGNSPGNLLDAYGLDWLDNISNFSAGWGDGLTFGLTGWIRTQLGVNDYVDECGGWYKTGHFVGVVHQAVLTNHLSGGAAGLSVKFVNEEKTVANTVVHIVDENLPRQLAAALEKKGVNVVSQERLFGGTGVLDPDIIKFMDETGVPWKIITKNARDFPADKVIKIEGGNAVSTVKQMMEQLGPYFGF